MKKPLVVHSREAESETLDILKRKIPKDHKIHIHCFTSSKAFAQDLIGYFPNLFIGFTGVITFASAQSTRDVVQIVPLERILLETDGPFMSPNGFRGYLSHPGFIPLVAKQIAEVKGIPVEKVLQKTRLNANLMYGCFPLTNSKSETK